ncbi:hypothetical protein KCU73_g16070, partial [Aureobasidium melanogenum]
MQKIGTESEKDSVEKEIAELKERLSQVEAWKQRKAEIEAELAQVWVEGGGVLETPEYAKNEHEKNEDEKNEDEEKQDIAEEVEVLAEEDGEEVALSETETEKARSDDGVRDDAGTDGYNTDNTQEFVTPAATPLERASP